MGLHTGNITHSPILKNSFSGMAAADALMLIETRERRNSLNVAGPTF